VFPVKTRDIIPIWVTFKAMGNDVT
jgi:hypothetical protein